MRTYELRAKGEELVSGLAIARMRDEMGFRNVIVMIPFCRTLDEADRLPEVMADLGLERDGSDEGLQVYVMCEIPSNVLLAAEAESG